jgi:ABC-2 type transport system ATP-binding protein
MIEVKDVTKRFGEIVALDRVSFTVREGEVVGFLGPNGAGKTTAMRIITGYMPPSEGSVTINGQDVFEHPYEVKKRIGYLPEHPPLYLDMTVKEYLEFASELRGMRGREVKRAVEQVVELCGISHVTGRLAGNLSKGYRQRLGLAQALVHDPEVLVLDEPTVGLDPKQIVEIRELIKNLGKEKTIILSTHVLQEVTTICESVIIINNGRILLSERLDRLSERFVDSIRFVVKIHRPEALDKERLLKLDGILSIDSLTEDIFEIKTIGVEVGSIIADEIVSMGAGLVELRSEGISLEDIFIKVVTENVVY